ncbi:porin family protein [Vibrio sp. Of14-4]|uniref:outer membrane beta-barrel protein n=1 Tax=Vibrio sp. Of14-4 TaxID=2724878 RepID=UPI001EF360BE|nr:outer membrane beta-barrel protein [Vibrio sp. Of14-4]MCG7489905.1 porin family protein [Vibrio sp. Of14-4]
MKKAVLAALVAAASFQVVGSEYVNDGWYIGADVMSTNVTVDGYDERTTGFALNAGYSFELHENFVIGVEADLAHYGEVDHGYGVTEDFASVGVNIKPKYFIGSSDFYLGAHLGLGYFLYNLEEPNRTHNTETDTTLTYGIETGYALNKNWLLNLGYRKASPELFGVEVDLDTIYGGIEYKF